MRRSSAAALMLLTAACQQGDRSSAPGGQGPTLATGLERAAIDSGAISDMARLAPVGLYQRTHEAGRDSLCVIPGGEDFRFGADLVFGEDQSCTGRGLARQVGDKLILRFEGGSGCLVVARYEGDQLTFPGVVDVKCAALCQGRGSFEGVSLPRITSDAASALRATTRGGGALCNGDG